MSIIVLLFMSFRSVVCNIEILQLYLLDQKYETYFRSLHMGMFLIYYSTIIFHNYYLI